MKKTKLYVLTGFLGAGKTTLLKNILSDLEDSKVGVIQNEFGKKSIDGEILENDGLVMKEVNRGSIFCSCLKLTFVEAMTEMADKELDYLFVESSGLADPSNMLEILEGVEMMNGDCYSYEGAICLVDGVNFKEQYDSSEILNRQIKHSHIAVINKSDLISEDISKEIKNTIMSVNSDIKIQETSFGKLNYEFIEKDLINKKIVSAEDTTNAPSNKPKTLTLTYTDSVQKDQLKQFLDVIKNDCYRIKGFFMIDNEWHQVDTVNKLVDFTKTDKVKENSQLVFISKIGPNVIKPIFNEWEKAIGTKMKLR